MSRPDVLGVVVRQPRDVEGPACRLLLSGNDPRPAGPRKYLVAVQDSAPNIVGAAAFVPRERGLFGLRVRVVKTHRRRGIGSRLLRHILDEGRRRNVAVAYAFADGRIEPDAGPFLAAHGFRFLGRVTTVEADVLTMRDYLVRLRDRLAASGGVPAKAKVLRFSEAPQDQVSRLHATHIAQNPEADPALFHNPGFQDKIASSPVLMVDDRVVGILLVTIDGQLATVHSRVVVPELRGGWVNAFLMGTAIEDGWRAGARRVRFQVPPDNPDTEKLARRFRAETVSALDRYTLSLTARQGAGTPE